MRNLKRQSRLPASTVTRSVVMRAGKMLVPLLGVLAALAIIVAAVAIVLQRQEREKREARERELQQKIVENDDLQTRFQNTQQAKAKVEEELSSARKGLADTQEQLTKAVEAQASLSRTLEEREQEVSRLTKELSQARDDAKETSAQLSQAQTERDTLKQEFTTLEQTKNLLETKVREFSGQPTVELEKVRVTNTEAQGQVPAEMSQPASSPSGGQPAGPANGQVVVVNREYDFIVMNIGRNHGLAVGQEFQVVRDNQVLGKVKVEKVYDELSAAAILPDSQKDNIREGDTVKAL